MAYLLPALDDGWHRSRRGVVLFPERRCRFEGFAPPDTEGRFGEMMLFGGWMMLAGLVLAALVLVVPVALAVVFVVMLTRNAKR